MHEDVKSKRWISMGGSKTEEELVRKAMSWSMSRGTVSRREDIGLVDELQGLDKFCF